MASTQKLLYLKEQSMKKIAYLSLVSLLGSQVIGMEKSKLVDPHKRLLTETAPIKIEPIKTMPQKDIPGYFEFFKAIKNTLKQDPINAFQKVDLGYIWNAHITFDIQKPITDYLAALIKTEQTPASIKETENKTNEFLKFIEGPYIIESDPQSKKKLPEILQAYNAAKKDHVNAKYFEELIKFLETIPSDSKEFIRLMKQDHDSKLEEKKKELGNQSKILEDQLAKLTQDLQKTTLEHAQKQKAIKDLPLPIGPN